MNATNVETLWRPLRKKQTEDNEYWWEVWKNIGSIVSKAAIDELIDITILDVQQFIKEQGFKNIGYGWSGGKDSIVLQFVLEHAHLNLKGIMATADPELEIPAFLKWVDANKPDGLQIIQNEKLNLEWLSENQHMLFPQTSKIAARWFSSIQHRSQYVFYEQNQLDLILLGRRRADGNYLGRDGSGFYTSHDCNIYTPIRGWTHEEILAAIHYYDLPWPPIYDYPNGLVVGTGAWPARQWTKTQDQGWYETYLVDPKIVHKAIHYIDSARSFLDRRKTKELDLTRTYRKRDGHYYLIP